ncbi:MAG: PD40 domain-containing protein, partial [Gemmatimonadetes bacterium]|nr:PD40 domain-containing protein [Gemmatimonadota bacterium]
MRARFSVGTLVLATALTAGSAASQTLLLRQPSVSDRHIAFAYANNIWVADRSGGEARRVTSYHGETADPKLSPDGKWIAFT